MYLGGQRPTDTPCNTHQGTLGEMGMPYVAYPSPESIEVTRYQSFTDRTHACPRPSIFYPVNRGDHVLFIGQIPKLLPLYYLPWAVGKLCYKVDSTNEAQWMR